MINYEELQKEGSHKMQIITLFQILSVEWYP